MLKYIGLNLQGDYISLFIIVCIGYPILFVIMKSPVSSKSKILSPFLIHSMHSIYNDIWPCLLNEGWSLAVIKSTNLISDIWLSQFSTIRSLQRIGWGEFIAIAVNFEKGSYLTTID